MRSRIAADRDRLNDVARAYGYYDGTIDIRSDVRQKPAKVTVTVTPGPRYTLDSVDIRGVDDGPLPPAAPTIAPDDIGLKLGGPALSAPVAAADAKVEHLFQQHAFPFAKVVDRKVLIDHGTQQMHVTYHVAPGPVARFGPTAVSGLETLDAPYVARRIDWALGQPYDVSLVDKTRDALVASNLFGTVRVAPAPQLDEAGAVPMQMELTERPPRSVSVGASYATTEGVAFNASWEHRNLLGGGEDLKFSLIGGQELSSAAADYRVPDQFGVGWDLVSSASIADEHAIAYTSKRERLFVGAEYKGLGDLAVGGGLALEHGIIDDYELQQHYTLIGIPVYARRDVTDDLLNPTRGNREDVTVTPYIDPFNPKVSFVSAKLKGSIYQRLGDSDRFVLAAFGAIGATFGIKLDDLPKDKRWYAGGGGSVRGYGYQLAGPLGLHEEPVGGLSSLETGVELRYKLTQTIGIVPFIDAGATYPTEVPDFSRRLFVGTGIGVRYYTGLGPVRFDVATPIYKRNVDRSIQIYVGLGQSF